MSKLKKITFLGLLTSIALVIYVIESQIPLIFPGIKLGLSNVISLTVLVIFGWKECITVTILRILLGSIFSGNMSSFMFSISGGIISNIVMIILYRYFRNYMNICTISITGAVFHNIGQLLIAAILINDFHIYIYLPILILSAVVTGYFIGLVTKYFSQHIKKFKHY